MCPMTGATITRAAPIEYKECDVILIYKYTVSKALKKSPTRAKLPHANPPFLNALATPGLWSRELMRMSEVRKSLTYNKEYKMLPDN